MPGRTVVSGDTVALRTVERDDAAFLQRASTDPGIRTPLGVSVPRTEAETEAFVEEVVEGDEGLTFLVGVDERPVGVVAAKRLEDRRPELTYWLVPDEQGHGYGSEAVSLLVDYVFGTFPVAGVFARAFATNDASVGLLESLGFEREGRFRDHRFVDGAGVDVVFYGLLRAEWAGEG
jgi:RimJ/RimL family protein N-acetyltransferase